MKLVRLLVFLLLVPLGAFLLFLLYASVDDYRPGEKVAIQVEGNATILPDTTELELVIWNIGYGGLDASMDFFYDGGGQMRPDEKGVVRNMEGIASILAGFKDYDFVLLQEVDRDSKRSYHRQQDREIAEVFADHTSWFGLNYDVFFVPIPLSEPMGKVESGLMTLSKSVPASVDRHGFPGNYAWPMKLFMLDRCFLVSRHPVSTGKELLVVNTHNSAYDDGSLRKEQMEYLQQFLLDEYQKGNWVIVGGDWNQTPFGFNPWLPSHRFDTINLTYVDKDYPAPGWSWAYDTEKPTNRRVGIPYERATSLTTVIDYYLLSPNVEVYSVETIDFDFRFSDHQPVILKARLKATKDHM